MRKILTVLALCVISATAWGETLSISGQTITERQDIDATNYETIVFQNSRFEDAVIISGNTNLKTILIYNCNFAGILSIKDNPALTLLAVGSGHINGHLLVNNNTIDGDVNFIDNYISGYFQFSGNHVKGKGDISLLRAEAGLSCFGNIFSSLFQINVSSFNLRSVVYKNRFNAFELNDASFGELTMQDNYLEKSMGFADCTITANLTIRQLNDVGDKNSKRSISFYNTSIYGSVHLYDIDGNIGLIDLWQIDFLQDFFIDYNRLINSIGLITHRIVHSTQSIETVVINNPYKELSHEDTSKFKHFLGRIKSGFDKRGDKEAKIDFAKWEFHYKNSLNNFPVKLLNAIGFYLTFEHFLNVSAALLFSLAVCILFMFIFLREDKSSERKYKYKYLKIDNLRDTESTSKDQKVEKFFSRYFTAFIVSTSVFCNLSLATKKMREENARNITWAEGTIGMIMLIIIGAIVGRIASI